eukprot:Sspe_Gene.90727::Locus_62215_Transcript_1_1_Confidence_1.000_Length_2384::g.90727::m.90727
MRCRRYRRASGSSAAPGVDGAGGNLRELLSERTVVSSPEEKQLTSLSATEGRWVSTLILALFCVCAMDEDGERHSGRRAGGDFWEEELRLVVVVVRDETLGAMCSSDLGTASDDRGILGHRALVSPPPARVVPLSALMVERRTALDGDPTLIEKWAAPPSGTESLRSTAVGTVRVTPLRSSVCSPSHSSTPGDVGQQHLCPILNALLAL